MWPVDTDISGYGVIDLGGDRDVRWVGIELFTKGDSVRSPNNGVSDHIIGAGWWAIGFANPDTVSAVSWNFPNFINFENSWWQGRTVYFADDHWDKLRYYLSPGTTGHIRAGL